MQHLYFEQVLIKRNVQRQLLTTKIRHIVYHFLFFGSKHGRAQGIASVFHLDLRRLTRLVNMHFFSSSFFALLGAQLMGSSNLPKNNSDGAFKPCGYMMDEGGAKWACLLKGCGEEETPTADSFIISDKQGS